MPFDPHTMIRGIIPPVATPMKDNENLDLPRLRWLLDHLIEHSNHDMFVLGMNPRVRHHVGTRPIWATPEGSRVLRELIA